MQPLGFFSSGLCAASVTAWELPTMARGICAAAVVTSWAQQETTTASTSPGLPAVGSSSWPLSGKGMVEFFSSLCWELRREKLKELKKKVLKNEEQ